MYGATIDVGLICCVGIRRRHFLLNSPNIIRSARTTITNMHHYLQINSIVITLAPQNKSADRQGVWAMTFYPCSCEDYCNDMKNDLRKSAFTYAAIVKMPGAIFGPETSPLRLQDTPSPRETYAYELAPLNRQLGFLLIAYISGPIKPDGFTATLQFEGDIIKICPRLETNQLKLDYDILTSCFIIWIVMVLFMQLGIIQMMYHLNTWI